MGLPLGLLMVIGGLLGTMSESMKLMPTLPSVLFWIAVTGGVVYFVRAAYFLIRAYHGHVYKGMPFALQRKEYRDQLREWHANHGALLAFYDFPAEHWGHLRTANPIESTFATVRLRQRRTKGCGSREASLTMVFMLARQAERHWRRLSGSEVIVHVLDGKEFKDG